ncbi:RHS repeat-associated core domain-containing protein [Pseudomonas alabamensis]|uniref:RHS repeat-associated core domain-containing protein n=1 Tax=Pseudomonas alabamensis TaxID=3064349 RepID=UPI0011A19737
MNTPLRASTHCIGRQTFDGLGRQSSITVGGRTTGYHYVAGQLPPCANTLADGQGIDFAYVAALDNQVAQIHPDGEPVNCFTYDPVLAMIDSSTGPLGQQTMTYTAGGKPKTDTWRVDGADHVTTWRHSLNGQLVGFEDADQVDHQRTFDAIGRLCRIEVGEICCDIVYDDFSRPCRYTTHDALEGRQLVQVLSYDVLGRECRREYCTTFEGKTQTLVQSLTYTALDQLKTRLWQDADHQGMETYSYDPLGRLRRYTADPAIAPADPFGNRVVEQCFGLNVLDGYETVSTTFADGSRDQATYHYANTKDPCQVSAIDHTHPSWPARISLEYDARGRLIRDSLGRTLSWDAQDRVTRVEHQQQTCLYGYDPSGNLCDRTVDGQRARGFFSAGQMTHEQRGADTLRPIGDAGQLLALQRLRAGVRQGNATLLGCDAQGSVRVEVDDDVHIRSYTTHGAEKDVLQPDDNPFGFAGERREPLTGWYIPAGYRPYDPLLMIFLAPDSLSPFGRGGLNAYAYCAGDPVNRIDPDGHGWLTWLVAGVGLALGVVATVASFGAAAPAFAAVYAGGLSALTASGAMAMGAATLGAISLGTGIASTVLEAVDKDSKAASVLGWVSLGTGLLGSGLEMAPKAASTLASKSRTIGRGFKKMTKNIKAQTTNSAKITPHKTSLPVVLHANTPTTYDVVFHPNYLGTGRAAFETHGSLSGELMDVTGKMVKPEKVALQAQDWLIANGRPEGEPFTLLACHGATSGAAQRVANITNRPVIAFNKKILVAAPNEMSSLTSSTGIMVPLEEASTGLLDRLLFRSKPPVIASSRIFSPKGRVHHV